MTQFYTYLWLREDGTPYYVGKGSGKRAFSNSGRILKRPKSRHMIIVQYWESEEKALEMEKWWISFWGRIDKGTGCLRNFTDGGEGISGLTHSDVSKQKMSKAHKGRLISEKAKSNMSESQKIRWARNPMSEEIKEKLRNREISDETKEKLSILAMGNHRTLGMKLNLSDEERKRRSVSAKSRVFSDKTLGVMVEKGRNRPKRKGSSSKYMGVHFFKRDSNWKVQFRINGKKQYFGAFPTEEEAAKVAAKIRAERDSGCL